MNEFKNLKKMKLSTYEKSKLFYRISSSIKKDEMKEEIFYPIPSPFVRFLFLFKSKQLQVATLFIFAVFLIGTTVLASLDTLPGDLLYGMKTNVVEKISDFVYITPEGQAENNLKKIEKRIDEFEKLAEKGKLTEENTKKIEKNIDKNFGDFDHSVEQIKEDTKEKEKENKDRLEKTLESNLKKHTEEIKKIREDKKVPNKRALQSVLERAHSLDDE